MIARSPNGTRVRRTCRWCSERFEVLPSRATGSRSVYCSVACSARAANVSRRDPQIPLPADRVTLPSCCPHVRATWPIVGHERCVIDPNPHALACVTHGVDLATPHHPSRPCDACRRRWRP